MSVVLFLCLLGSFGSWEICGPGGTKVFDLHTMTTPSDSEVLFSLCSYPDNDECFRSFDNGETWESTAVPAFDSYSISSDGSGRVFITCDSQVLISSDLGDSWAAYPTVPEAMMMSLAVDPSDPQHLLGAVRNADHPLLESVDNGVSWSAVTSLPEDIRGYKVAFSQSNPDVVYLAGNPVSPDYYLMVFKSTDGGVSWSEVSPSPECQVSATEVIKLIVADNDPDMVFVTAEELLMTTSNGGSTWSECLNASYDIEDLCFDNTQGIIYATTIYKLYKSYNNGTSWVSSTTLPEHTYALALSDCSGERIHLGTYFGHFHGNSPGGPWTISNTGIPGGSFYALLENENDDSGFPVLTGSYFLNEDAISWEPAGDLYLYQVWYLARAAADPELLFAAGDAG